ncbi:MAG: hypothetical protein QG629_713 [Patescibacteria group bacterium]|nr:AI-2E family transporter [Candidatus Saccharibacteria bacterium]MDQ5963630.1 hypothetical protein [Patescibacteria group bacterium]
MGKLIKKEDADFEVSVSTHSIVRFIAIVLGAVLLVRAVQQASHVLTLIGVAFFLALALNAPVRWLTRKLPGKKQSRRNLATALSIGLIVALLIGFLLTIVPPLTKQTINFIQAVPSLVDDTRNGSGPIGEFVSRYNLEDQVDKLSGQLSSRVGNIGTSALSTVSRIGSSLISLLTVLVLTVMMLIEAPAWRKVLEDMVPTKQQVHYQKLGREMNKVVQGYVNGQVLLAGMAAIFLLPVFIATGVSYPVALMVVVFICGLIPMVGHTIGALICTLVALFHSFTAAIIVMGVYILYQQVENYAVQPKIQSNSTNMSPLLVFVAVLLGGSFGGLLGALVAIPVAGCIRILLLDYFERRNILSRSTVSDAKKSGGTI